MKATDLDRSRHREPDQAPADTAAAPAAPAIVRQASHPPVGGQDVEPAPPMVWRFSDGITAGLDDLADPGAAFSAATANARAEVPFRDEMEQIFGEEFGDVRAHFGGTAGLRALGARAATDGQSIAFGDAPSRELVAHELTHVVQHRRGGGGSIAASSTVSEPTSASELEADAVASQVAGGATRVRVGATAGGGLQLTPETDRNRDWIRVRIEQARDTRNGARLREIMAALSTAISSPARPGSRANTVVVRVPMGTVQVNDQPPEPTAEPATLTRADAAMLHSLASQATQVSATTQSMPNLDHDRARDELRAMIEGAQTRREAETLGQIADAIRQGIGGAAGAGTGPDTVQVHIPASAQTQPTQPAQQQQAQRTYTLTRADAATLHTLATSGAQTLQAAAPAEHATTREEQAEAEVQLWDTHLTDEHLGNFHMIMRVARAPTGQVYPLIMDTRPEMYGSASHLSFGANAMSTTVNNGGNHATRLRFNVRVAGPNVVRTDTTSVAGQVQVSPQGMRGIPGLPAGATPSTNAQVQINATQTWSTSSASQAGASFIREYLVTGSPNGPLSWQGTDSVDIRENQLWLDDANVGTVVDTDYNIITRTGRWQPPTARSGG
jgi:hypothetical protein